MGRDLFQASLLILKWEIVDSRYGFRYNSIALEIDLMFVIFFILSLLWITSESSQSSESKEKLKKI